jgi:hypothetical protein
MMPSHTNPKDVDPAFSGLSKREYFAGLILAGLSVPTIPGSHNTNFPDEAIHKVAMAVRLSDALIAELEKSK